MSDGSWLSLDVGTRRIGVALARADVRMAQPLTTIENAGDAFEAIKNLVQEHEVQRVIVGLPRGMDGQETEQTRYTENFAKQLETKLGLSVIWQDEALTSQKAESELTARKKPFTKGDVDALAATYILDDYITEHAGASYV